MLMLSHVQLFVTLWTVACQAALSLGFSRQEYLSGLPFPLPEDLPHPGIEPTGLHCRWILDHCAPWALTPCRVALRYCVNFCHIVK